MSSGLPGGQIVAMRVAQLKGHDAFRRSSTPVIAVHHRFGAAQDLPEFARSRTGEPQLLSDRPAQPGLQATEDEVYPELVVGVRVVPVE